MRKSLKQSAISIMVPVVLSLVLSSCATEGRRQAAETPEAASSKGPALSKAEQVAKATELFRQVVDILGDSDRKTAVPKMEVLYKKIIDEYPEAPVAQECYWRLILIYLRDYTPPQFGKAEEYHRRFVGRYPDSQFRREIEDSMAKAYYTGGKWSSLLALYTPEVKRYIESGKLDRPQDMFLYAEAKMNLGDLVEAEKGYRIVVSLFPATREGSLAKMRLEKIAKSKETGRK